MPLIAAKTRFHFTDSPARNRLNSSGVALAVGNMLASTMCLRTSASAIALSAAACSLATIGAGVLATARKSRFKAKVDHHLRSLRNSKALPGNEVQLPGDQRAKRRADRVANGLALAPELLVQLDKLAGELSIKPLGAR